jgi:SAM-dependent methyltransferase
LAVSASETSAGEAVWHDVECGPYAADLALWSQIAREAAGPLVELGAGTGRVALSLAAQGFEVTALDSSATLLGELSHRARARGIAIETLVADAREFESHRRFAAVIAPMQLVHLLGGERDRRRMLEAVRAQLAPGAVLAAAILSGWPPPSPATGGPPPALTGGPRPLPDVVERDGWIYSSLPLEVVSVACGLEVRRLRQVVAPSGELTERVSAVRLDRLDADRFEAEAAGAGLRPRERFEVPATDDHVGSVVCVLEAS